MNHDRVIRAVVTVTVGYVVLLAIWIAFLVKKSPSGTIPYQLAGLVALFGASLGLAMMWASRPSRDERRLERDGLEGWAVIDEIRERGASTELDLSITVPGTGSYRGSVVRPGSSGQWHRGDTVSIKVDPEDRQRIQWL
ncbi:hypothetical protein [Rhodococcoides trifolii]|nr:hypothetical protein [Rhodococcus trifolii]